ncbi:MAG: hypothetical protein M3Y55_10650 [Pseudomonadota bacterium]|nr:hypothetical protein [Pseudomonadota bacterium]
MNSIAPIKWLDQPEEHDYPAAQSYLELIYEEAIVRKYVQELRAAGITTFMAKDIFRASALSLLGISSQRVESDRQKVASGKSMSPLLLVRDSGNGKVIVADGYHRLCAVYSYDESALIPCKIV